MGNKPKKKARSGNVSLFPGMDYEDLDRDEFEVSASDDKGHSAKMFFRIAPRYAGNIENFVASKSFPYRNSSELLRHAVKRHLKWLASIRPEIDNDLHWLEMTEAFIAGQRRLDEYENIMGATKALIAKKVALGQRGEARKTLLGMIRNIKKAPDSERIYRETYLKECEAIDKQYNLLSEKVSIRPSEASEED